MRLSLNLSGKAISPGGIAKTAVWQAVSEFDFHRTKSSIEDSNLRAWKWARSAAAPDLIYTEEILRLTYRGVSERVVIGLNEKTEKWVMRYLRPGQDGDSAQVTITDGESREDIIKRTLECVTGHGKALVENVIQSWEEDGDRVSVE